MARRPVCQSGPTWIRRRLQSNQALAPLTSQDWPALQAFLHLVELYGNADDEGRRCALAAMAWSVCAMQPSTRHLAKAGIPHVLDWSHEAEIWDQVQMLVDIAIAPTTARGETPIERATNDGSIGTGPDRNRP